MGLIPTPFTRVRLNTFSIYYTLQKYLLLIASFICRFALLGQRLVLYLTHISSTTQVSQFWRFPYSRSSYHRSTFQVLIRIWTQPITGCTNPNLFDIARPTSSVLYKLLYQTTTYFFNDTLSSPTLRFPVEPPNPVEVSLFLTGASICRYRIAKPRSVITFHYNFIKEHTLRRVRNHDNRHTIWSPRRDLHPRSSGYEPDEIN